MKKIFIIFLSLLLIATSATGCFSEDDAELKKELSSEEVFTSPGVLLLKKKIQPLIDAQNIQVNDMFVIIGYNRDKTPYISVTTLTGSKTERFFIETTYVESLSNSIIYAKDTIVVDKAFLAIHSVDNYSENESEQIEISIEDFLLNVDYDLEGNKVFIK